MSGKVIPCLSMPMQYCLYLCILLMSAYACLSAYLCAYMCPS